MNRVLESRGIHCTVCGELIPVRQCADEKRFKATCYGCQTDFIMYANARRSDKIEIYYHDIKKQ